MKEPRAILLAGLGYGDEGKGATVDYLVRQHNAKAVVRYNGGPQAAHNVVTDDGRHHTFAQWGSGTFNPGVLTYLSRFMLFNPFNMVKEGDHLVGLGVPDAFDRLYVDRDAPVVTPYHRAANRVREQARGVGRHGSCGLGIGETMIDLIELGPEAIYVKDLTNASVLRRKLEQVRERKVKALQEAIYILNGGGNVSAELEILLDSGFISTLVEDYQEVSKLFQTVDGGFLAEVLKKGPVVFEGAQGVLLDQTYGFQPYTTWTDITYNNAEKLLQDSMFTGEVSKVGVLRAYATRHGAGPFTTEDDFLTATYPDLHNGIGEWQGSFRVGNFDLVAAKYALEVIGGIDELALTCLDRAMHFPELKLCVGYKTRSCYDDMFEYTDGIATKIKVLSPTTEQHQMRLANVLNEAIPQYKHIGGMSEFVSTISDELHTTISSLSYGLTVSNREAELVALL